MKRVKRLKETISATTQYPQEEPNWQKRWITGQQSPEDYRRGMEEIRKRNRRTP